MPRPRKPDQVKYIFEPVRIKDWADAYHVYADKVEPENRLGIVNKRSVRGGTLHWCAHNKHFMTVEGMFADRMAAARALPLGPIHQKSNALRGAR